MKNKLKLELMNFIDDLKDFYTHDWWELKDSLTFYKQAFRDFCYATKLLLLSVLSLLLLIIVPFISPLIFLIRLLNSKGKSWKK